MATDQAAVVVDLIREILSDAVLGIYLHGSSVTGSLRPTSDIDLFVVTSRRTTDAERRDLIERLLPISGPGDPSGRSRSINVEAVARDDARPWRYPVRLDFQFGDWYRPDFAKGDFAPWDPANPDLAIVLEMVLQANRPLFGPPPAELFGPIPWADVRRAMVDTIPDLLSYLDGDERNVVLTFARIWATLTTGRFMSKDGAADWAIPRLPEEHRAVLAQARSLYIRGIAAEEWGDLMVRVRPCVDHLVGEIERSATPATLAHAPSGAGLDLARSHTTREEPTTMPATTPDPATSGLRMGVLLWNQATTWPEILEAARTVDRLGYDHLWAWDHINAIFGDWDQPIFDGWALLYAYAMATEQTRLGLLVGANTFRNPGIQAKNATSLDHISGGRAILGVGAAWFDKEHEAHGIAFGRSPGQRLDWLDESVGLQRRLLDGEVVTSRPAGRYAMLGAHQLPLPIQPHLPIMIGGSGEKKTLRTVARYADMWNAMGPLDEMAHKVDVLRQHCADVGRDIADIEFTLGVKVAIRDSEAEARRVQLAALAHNKTDAGVLDEDDTFWCGTPEQIAERLIPYVKLGFGTVISEQPAPYDIESIERFIGQVKPLVDRG